MKTPQEKYENDANYRYGVDMFLLLIHQGQFTPSEIREMAIFACIRYEMLNFRPSVVNKKVEEALEHIATWRKTQER